MRLIITLSTIFIFSVSFAQHGTHVYTNPVTGDIRTTVFSQNIGQKVKNVLYRPYYYTKTTSVKDSTGRPKCYSKMKRLAFGCDRDIGPDYKFVQYNPDNTVTIIKHRGSGIYMVKTKKHLRVISIKKINRGEVIEITRQFGLTDP